MSHWIHGLLQVPPNAVLVPLANPTHFNKPVKHSLQTTPIFQKFPGTGDIQQGHIGNCWQLAAINACLSRPEGPAAIMGLMVDKGGGMVIVRLYIDRAWRYYHVEKSICLGSTKNQSGALWVNILEKALLMTLSKGDYDHNGGLPMNGMDALLGEAAKFNKGATDQYSTLTAVLTGCADGSKLSAGRQASLKRYALEMFGGDEGAYARFAQWNKGALMRSGGADFLNPKTPAHYTLVCLQEHLRGLDADVRGMLEAWAVKMSAVGTSGRYSARALQTYQEIARAVATQYAVTAETTNDVSGPKGYFDRFNKGTAGESKVAGIYTTHAYTVIGVEARGEYLGVIVRNPHGRNNRGYDWNKDGTIGNAKSIGSADGWIELNDYMQNFKSYTAGGSVASAGRQALMGQISGARPVTRPRSTAVPPPPPPPTRPRR